MYFKLVIVFVVLELSSVKSWGDSDRVRLRDVTALTLRQNQKTNGRRSSPIPQLQCVGGNAGCHAFTPQVVQCRNVGFDGYDVQWECKTDMDDSYRFGRVQVSCEGYDYPNDEYILKGSCGLEYTIDYTEAGKARKSSWGSNYGKTYGASTWNGNESDGGSWFIFFLIVFGVVFLVCKMSSSDSDEQRQSRRAPTAPYPDNQGPRYRGRNDPPPYGFKPEYSGTGHHEPPTYDQATGRCGSQSSPVGGFWSGLGMGSVAGYLFGSRRNNYAYHHQPYNGGWGWGNRGYGWGSGYSSGGGWGRSWGSSSSYSSGRTSGTSRTTSGFGGTSRR